MMRNNPEIPLTMPLDELNKLLTMLGTHPYNDVADMIMDLRQQTQQQIQTLQQQMQQQPQMPQRINGEDRADRPALP